jgi:Tfp pilus assembly protein PilN
MRNPFQRPIHDQVSFLPADYIQRRAETRANLITLSLFGVVMFGVVAAYFVTNRQWLRVRDEQASVNEEYAQEAAKIEQLRELDAQKAALLERAAITNSLVEKVPRRVLIEELVARMPENVTLTDLKLTTAKDKDVKAASPGAPQIRNLSGSAKNSTDSAAKPAPPKPGSKKIAGKGEAKDQEAKQPKIVPTVYNYRLSVIGVATTNNDVADYLAGLKQSTVFENVDIKYIQPKMLDKAEMRGFEIELSIRKDVDARSLEPLKDLQRGAERAPKADRAAIEAVKNAVDAFKTAIQGEGN